MIITLLEQITSQLYYLMSHKQNISFKMVLRNVLIRISFDIDIPLLSDRSLLSRGSKGF